MEKYLCRLSISAYGTEHSVMAWCDKQPPHFRNAMLQLWGVVLMTPPPKIALLFEVVKVSTHLIVNKKLNNC